MGTEMDHRCALFFGDSFVAGAGDQEGAGWPGRVVAASWEAGLPMRAYNLGVAGETSSDVAARFEAEASPRLVPGADNLAVVSFGANDVDAEGGGRAVEDDRSVANLEAIVDSAERLGMRSLVVGPGPAGVEDHDARSRELSERFAALCERKGVPYVEVLDDLLADEDWREGARANDGLHPGAAGYRSLARLVLDAGWSDWLRQGR